MQKRTVIVTGEVGAGKSCICNILCGALLPAYRNESGAYVNDNRGSIESMFYSLPSNVNKFAVGEENVTTVKCGKNDGISVKVYDTPGLLNENLNDDTKYNEIIRRYFKGRGIIPHCIIIVKKYDDISTDLDKRLTNIISYNFQPAQKSCVLLITHVPGGVTISNEKMEEYRKQYTRNLNLSQPIRVECFSYTHTQTYINQVRNFVNAFMDTNTNVVMPALCQKGWIDVFRW